MLIASLCASQITCGVLDDKHTQGRLRRKDGAPFCASPIGDPIKTTHADVQRGATIFEVEGLPRNGGASLIVNDDEVRSGLREAAAKEILQDYRNIGTCEHCSRRRIELCQPFRYAMRA
jgi:hypothetical protein